MELTIRHLGSTGGSPAKIIELTAKSFSGSSSITESITNLKGVIDYDFIQNLRQLADELEEQNQMIANTTEF